MVVKWPYTKKVLRIILSGDKKSQISARDATDDTVYVGNVYSRYYRKRDVAGRNIREDRIFVFPTLKELSIDPLQFSGSISGSRLINFISGCHYGNMVFIATIETVMFNGSQR